MSGLALRSISKSFKGANNKTVEVLKDISLDVSTGGFMTLLGPSGCGKSTLLNIIAGFESPTHGEVLVDGRPISAPDVDRAVVFQDVSNALFPWMNAQENVEFGPKMMHVRPEERRRRADQYLNLVGLKNDAAKFPFELSGGMKQRVQIARALATEPKILLMDEPFAALDAITKKYLQAEFRRIWQETGKTIVYITHDIFEALSLSTCLAVMTVGPSAHIRKIFDVKLNEPRAHSNEDFIGLYQEVEKLIDEEVAKGRSR